MYHVDKNGKAWCGAEKVKAMELVERPVRSDCDACRRLAKLDPLTKLELKVAEPPSVDELLGRLIRVLCAASPAERRALTEKALAVLEVP